MNLKTRLGQFRVIALLEGISFLLLLFIAMPLKYALDIPEAVRIIGMAHGVLFVAYVIWLYLLWMEDHWKLKDVILAFVVSLLPFGTFYAEKKWWK